MLFLSAGWLLFTDIWLGLVAVAVFPLLIGLNLTYQRRVDKYYDTAQEELGKLSEAVHESFDGVTVVKSFGAESRETDRLSVIASRLRNARFGAIRLRSTFEALLDGVPTVVNIVLLVLGSYRVRSGAMTIGELTSFIYLFTLLVFPLRLIGFALSELPYSIAGWNRIRELLDQPVQSDPALTLRRHADNSIELDGVSYNHDGTRDVLHAVSAVIPGGRTVAVVGPTGAGKTTFLQLIAGLIPVDSGSITVPQEGCVLVFQEPFLLAGSVRDNVAMGRSTTDEEIWTALSAAEASFVHEFTEGLDTIVGERGIGLSGGQRQRVASGSCADRRPRRPAARRHDVVTGSGHRSAGAGQPPRDTAQHDRGCGRVASVDHRLGRRRVVPVRRSGRRPRSPRAAAVHGARVPPVDGGVRARSRRADGRGGAVTEPISRWSAVQMIGKGVEAAPALRRGNRCDVRVGDGRVRQGAWSCRSSSSRRSTAACNPARSMSERSPCWASSDSPSS